MMRAAMKRLELANFNLNLLLALDGLLSERSVTAAAKRVRVTPSAMSPFPLRSCVTFSVTHSSFDPAGEWCSAHGPRRFVRPAAHLARRDAERLLRGGTTFDPATAARHFVIAAPDFLATLLLPPLLDAAAGGAGHVVGDRAERAARERVAPRDGRCRSGARHDRST